MVLVLLMRDLLLVLLSFASHKIDSSLERQREIGSPRCDIGAIDPLPPTFFGNLLELLEVQSLRGRVVVV